MGPITTLAHGDYATSVQVYAIASVSAIVNQLLWWWPMVGAVQSRSASAVTEFGSKGPAKVSGSDIF